MNLWFLFVMIMEFNNLFVLIDDHILWQILHLKWKLVPERLLCISVNHIELNWIDYYFVFQL